MRTFSAGKTDPRRGFTLLEMIVVLALLAIALTLVVGVNFRQSDRLLLQDFGTSLCAYFGLARSEALADGRREACFVDQESRKVFGSGLSTSLRIPDGVYLERRETLWSQSNGTLKLVEFFMDGSSSGGEIAISYKGYDGLVVVDPLLGQTRLAW